MKVKANFFSHRRQSNVLQVCAMYAATSWQPHFGKIVFNSAGNFHKCRRSRYLRPLSISLLCWPLIIGCVENPLAPEPQQADAQDCFMRAMSYCREVGPSCIDAELRACDEALARNAPPITEGLSAKLIACFEENQGASEQSPSRDWRRCLHMLEAE